MAQFIAGIIVAVFFCIVVAVAYVAGLNDKVKPLRNKITEDEQEKKEAEKRMKDFERLMNYTERQAMMRAGE